MLGQQSSWLSLLLETLCLLGETSEEEDEVSEPRSSTSEQAGFDWAQVWVEEGGSLVLVESESWRLLIQVFSF